MLWAILNLPGIDVRPEPTHVKHGVSFEEAQSVFLDESARLIDDPDHSGGGRSVFVAWLQLRRALPHR
jgi:uncharacterized DUF497 family protein